MTFSRGLCPKLAWVRTQDGLLPRFVSDGGLGSDSESLFTQVCVRSYARFGLRMTFSKVLCPKLAWVLTQLRFLPRVVSEAHSGSDSD